MRKSTFSGLKKAIAVILIPTLFILPARAFGEVSSIQDTQGKLENISEEEMKVLNELFVISQQLEIQEQERLKISEDIKEQEQQYKQLVKELDKKQKDYEDKLEVLSQVLRYYQRGGPATYLEILLSADSLSSFLKSLNVIKDITHNVGDLLDTVKQEKAALQEQVSQVEEQTRLLEEKEKELQDNIHKNELLKQQKDEYLASLKTERSHYEEQLSMLETMWGDNKKMFSGIVEEANRMISEGYISTDDMKLQIGLFGVKGALEEETFNSILKKNSKLPEIIFHFHEEEIVIEIPENHLVLSGNFTVSGTTAIQFEVEAGSFYEIPLEKGSIEELFENGPIVIDFADFTESIMNMSFTLQQVQSTEGELTFDIGLSW